MQSVEISQVTQMMYETSQRIDKATRTIYDLAKEKAETERQYRMELSKQITSLRSEGVQATLIPDIARGNVAELKQKRDYARDMYRSAISSLEALKTEASVLQTISKYQTEVD